MRRHLIGLLGAGLLCLLAVPASTAHSADTASSTARGVTSTVLSSGTAHPVLGEVSKVDLSASEMTKLHLWPDASRARAASLPRSSTSTQDGGGAYTALAPSRLLDTRVTGDDLGRGASLNLTVTGGSVPTTATAVALNVTVTDTTASSYLSVYPSGATRPVVSSLNWTRGRTVANLVIVPVGADGQVTFFNDLGSTAVIADLEGYFSPSTGTTAGSYVALTPERIVDTRTGSGLRDAGAELGPHEYLQVPIDGNTELPSSGVEAVLCNITAVDTTASSYFTVYPDGTSIPVASNLNWTAGETVSNRVVVPVGTDGEIDIANDAGHANLVIDVEGYFTSGSTAPSDAAVFYPMTPVRLLDTRQTDAPLGPSGILTEPIAGADGIPSSATAIVTNLTAVDPTTAGYLTVYPSSPRPTSSDLNWRTGETVANLTVATLGSGGGLDIYNSAGSTNVLIDAFGYFALPSAPTATAPTVTSVSPTSGPSSGGTTVTITGSGFTGATAVDFGATATASFTVESSTAISALTPAESAGTVDVAVTTPAGSSVTSSAGAFTFALAAAPTTQVGTSTNWSGYAATSGPYTAVTGTFTIPSLDSGQEGTDLSEWAGIDGDGNSSLIQAGISEEPDPSNSSEFYLYPWWEILPASETEITTMTVSPGDSLTVSIDEISSGEWQIELTDHTDDQSFSIDQSYYGPGTSAEWIVEAPTVNGAQSTLADYTTTEFDALGIEGSESTLTTILMVQNGVEVSTPSTLSSTGFDVAYGPNAPPPP